MKSIVVIPARYGSTRLPGKPLIQIKGKPLIQYVYENAVQAELAERAIVATDDERIIKAVQAFGGEALMTSTNHPSGTDRVAEVVKGMDVEVVVNLQGDEPLVRPEMIDDVISILTDDKRADIGTLAKKIDNLRDALDPNVVKAVFDRDGFAMYFSRSPVPFYRDFFSITPEVKENKESQRTTYSFACMINNDLIFYKHIGLYSYRKPVLMRLTELSPTYLEKAERLEQLRALQSGYKIKIKETVYDTMGVDTMQDLQKIKEVL